MLDFLKSAKSVKKVQNETEKTIIDNAIFRLHYRTTSIILFVCCALATAYTMFGEPIQCMGKFKEEEERKEANTYCYYLGYTYTASENHSYKYKEKLDGIGHDEEKKYHFFYRWVPQMLFLQALSFYLSHWIWKTWEKNKINNLTKEVCGPVVNVGVKQRTELKSLAKYAANSLHTHNSFALMYYFCEILNFIIVIANICLIDTFLNGKFMKYGLNFLNFKDMPHEDETDPMIKVFPRVTKCDFYKIGDGGIMKTYDLKCILALNNLNEKIYIFLWFWLIFMAFVSILPILYNVAIFLSSTIRKRELRKHYILDEKCRIEELVEETRIGDFFLWDLLGRNMSPKCYREFISELYECLKVEKNNSHWHHSCCT